MLGIGGQVQVWSSHRILHLVCGRGEIRGMVQVRVVSSCGLQGSIAEELLRS